MPGVADPGAPVDDRVLAALREAAARGTRIASICVGAFVLAATGPVDGQRATTHWAAADALARAHPAITVDAWCAATTGPPWPRRSRAAR